MGFQLAKKRLAFVGKSHHRIGKDSYFQHILLLKIKPIHAPRLNVVKLDIHIFRQNRQNFCHLLREHNRQFRVAQMLWVGEQTQLD